MPYVAPVLDKLEITGSDGIPFTEEGRLANATKLINNGFGALFGNDLSQAQEYVQVFEERGYRSIPDTVLQSRVRDLEAAILVSLDNSNLDEMVEFLERKDASSDAMQSKITLLDRISSDTLTAVTKRLKFRNREDIILEYISQVEKSSKPLKEKQEKSVAISLGGISKPGMPQQPESVPTKPAPPPSNPAPKASPSSPPPSPTPPQPAPQQKPLGLQDIELIFGASGKQDLGSGRFRYTLANGNSFSGTAATSGEINALEAFLLGGSAGNKQIADDSALLENVVKLLKRLYTGKDLTKEKLIEIIKSANSKGSSVMTYGAYKVQFFLDSATKLRVKVYK